MLFIYPYNMASESSILLAKALQIRRIKREGSKIRDSADLTIINWGSATVPYERARLINKPGKVGTAANKLRCFRCLADNKLVKTPAFTTDYKEAAAWITEGSRVCARKLLNASGGKGLVVADNLAGLPKDAPLYTKYRPKSAEYRVHVFVNNDQGRVVRVQKKVWPAGKEKPKDLDWAIRNHENGFIFQVAEAGEVPFKVVEQAKLSVQQLGLDFGGVDVIWDQKNQWAGILEVNTAPGIEGETVDIYAETFKDILR